MDGMDADGRGVKRKNVVGEIAGASFGDRDQFEIFRRCRNDVSLHKPFIQSGVALSLPTAVHGAATGRQKDFAME